MAKPLPIFLATILLITGVYFLLPTDKNNTLVKDPEVLGSKANVGFDLLRTADPNSGKIPSGAIMKAYRELKGRGFYTSRFTNFKTEDGTDGWQQINDFFPSLSITKIAYDPNNTQIFYFCTGEGWYNADAVRGAGVFKSTDGGETWAQLASTDTTIFDYCQDLVVHPLTSDVYVATRSSGLQRSTDGGAPGRKC